MKHPVPLRMITPKDIALMSFPCTELRVRQGIDAPTYLRERKELLTDGEADELELKLSEGVV